ncbi:SDR family oxidoreductase [Pseudomonas aeruginosa]
MQSIQGKVGLVVCVSNDHSIAWAYAKALHGAGANTGGFRQAEKARAHVESRLEAPDAPIRKPLDVFHDVLSTTRPCRSTLRASAMERARKFSLPRRSATTSNKVCGSSRSGFLQAMDLPCHSYARMARLADPRMVDGGSLMTMNYLDAMEVVPNCGLMDPLWVFLASDGAHAITGSTLCVNGGQHILN